MPITINCFPTICRSPQSFRLSLYLVFGVNSSSITSRLPVLSRLYSVMLFHSTLVTSELGRSTLYHHSVVLSDLPRSYGVYPCSIRGTLNWFERLKICTPLNSVNPIKSFNESSINLTWSVVMQFQANSVKSWATINYQCRSSQLTSIFLSLSCPPSVKSCVVLVSFPIASSSSLSIRCNRPSASLSCTRSISLRFQCGTVGVVIIMFTNYHTDPNTQTQTHAHTHSKGWI